MSQDQTRYRLTDRGIFFLGFAVGFTVDTALVVLLSRVFFGH